MKLSTDARIYRDGDRAFLSGICAGVAKHFQIPVVLVRVLCVMLFFVSGFFPLLLAYIALSFVIPVQKQDVDDSQKRQHLSKDRLVQMDQRIARLENYLISSEYELEVKLKQL